MNNSVSHRKNKLFPKDVKMFLPGLLESRSLVGNFRADGRH